MKKTQYFIDPNPVEPESVESGIDEINEMIADYNAAEKLQYDRLDKLFKWMAGRKGAKEVVFSQSKWGGNVWLTERLDLALHRNVDPMVAYIVSINPGRE